MQSTGDSYSYLWNIENRMESENMEISNEFLIASSPNHFKGRNLWNWSRKSGGMKKGKKYIPIGKLVRGLHVRNIKKIESYYLVQFHVIFENNKVSSSQRREKNEDKNERGDNKKI